jgi:site-specific DNA-methyltransferase (adenine-specific)
MVKRDTMKYPDDFINKIICSDCLEVMKDIPDKSVDMILADLPYGTTACKWDTIIPFEPLWEQYKRIIKDNGAIVLTASQPFTSALVMSNVDWFRYELIWEKERPTNIMFMKKQIGKVHENILVFYKHQPTYNPLMTKRDNPTIAVYGKDTKGGDSKTHKNQRLRYSEGYNRFVKYPRSVIKINRDTLKGSMHPTQKPVALFEYLIKTYTNEGDLVLDNTAGSGTTGVACKNLNRNYILIEKEPEYIDIINKRLNTLNQERLFE